MDSIGQTLKAARESRNMEIQDVVAATLMQPHVISAIENDDFAAMPAPVYARGFIRLYAESMGLDPAPLIQAYNDRGRQAIAPQRSRFAREKPKASEPRQPEQSAKQDSPASITPPAPPLAVKPEPDKHSRQKRREPIRLRMPKLPKLPKPELSFGAVAHRLSSVMSRVKTSLSRMQIPRPDASRIVSSIRAGAGAISRRFARISLPNISISYETSVIAVRSILAVLFLAAAVSGILWFSERTKPRVFSSRLIMEAPTPYVEFRPVKQ